MRRLISFAISFAAAVSVSASALAANILFEKVAFDNSVLTTPVLDPESGLPLYTNPETPEDDTTTDPGLGGDPITTPSPEECPAPCFLINVYWQDPTRTAQITAIQFDIAVIGGTVASMPVPPDVNDTARNGTAFSTKKNASGPWDLSSTVGKSPNAGYDVLVVDAASLAYSVNTVTSTLFPTNTNCVGDNCTAIRAGLVTGTTAINGIYLGAFLEYAITGTGYRISNPLGNGSLPAGGECTFGNTGNPNRCTVPEPSSLLILGIALAGLGAIRRRTA